MNHDKNQLQSDCHESSNAHLEDSSWPDDMTMDFLVEKSMKSMGLDPKNPKDIQEFWMRKGLID